MTHTAEVTLTPEQVAKIEKLKKKHFEQDQRDIFGKIEAADDKVADTPENGNEFSLKFRTKIRFCEMKLTFQ